MWGQEEKEKQSSFCFVLVKNNVPASVLMQSGHQLAVLANHSFLDC
jgi:hypothetical protein